MKVKLSTRISNLWLCFKYPFLRPWNRWSGKRVKFFGWFGRYTELDAMPDAWKNDFGIKMTKEIAQALKKTGGRKAVRAYRITQIKEKYGSLRWYDYNTTDEVLRIISKYTHYSTTICQYCGKKADYCTDGWITYLCGDCLRKEVGSDIDIEQYNRKNWEDEADE